ncbi:MAG: type II secretion system protein GspN [Deltaproteobacteria bacterium]|nr:type II secretion system protein GspN [Deltaproteobacteria bacterium]
MNKTKGKNKRWFGYTLYGILLAVALLYYRFPSESFREYFETIASRTAPDLRLSIEELSPSFPFGVILAGTELSLKEEPDRTLIIAEPFHIRPDIKSFLAGGSGYFFKCSAYGGDLTGHVRFPRNDSGTPFTASIQLNKIDISNSTLPSQIFSRNMNGILSGTVTYKEGNVSPINGTGKADLLISDGAINLLQPLLGLESINFDELILKMTFKDRMLSMPSIELKGRKIDGNASGTIYLKTEIMQSRLNLKGTIEPFADLFKNTGSPNVIELFRQRLKGGKLSFSIQGTIKDPRIRFI